MKWMLVLLLLTAPTQAQQVHKCMADDGQVSYQSAPCQAGQRLLKQWQAVPEPITTAAGQIRSDTPAVRVRKPPKIGTRSGARPRAQAVRGSVIAAENNGGSAACLAAKRQRQQTLERVGLKRTYALLQRLDDAVWRTCN